MSAYVDCKRLAHQGFAGLLRRYLSFISSMGLFVVVGAACSGRHKTENLRASAEASDNSEAESSQAGLATSKSKPRNALKDRPSQLVYRQAGELARQRLTAENAHLRLDELDAQIEHERESRP